MADTLSHPVHRVGPGRRVLVVRLGAMGDVLHAMPAVAALRAAMPSLTVGWCIEERWAELLRGTGESVLARTTAEEPLVDVIHTVNTRAWRSAPFSDETWSEIAAARREIRAMRYDVALDFQGALKSATIAQLSGAVARFGFAHPRETLAALFYSHRVQTSSSHVIEQNVELASAIAGRLLAPTGFDLALDEKAEAWCDRELTRLGVARYAILNPGAGWGAKRWPAESYATVARELAAQGITSLINHAPAEFALASQVESMSAGAAKSLVCSISELVSLTRRASLVIAGDTGPLHLAAAMGVPVIALFGPTDPARNGPYGSRSVVLRNNQSTTSYKHHSRVDEGLASITPAEVIDAAKELLASA